MADKKLDRRHFLSFLGAGGISSYLAMNAGFIDYLGSAMANALINQAHAGSGPVKNYLCFLHPGGPPRWQFDGFLATSQRIVNGAANSEFIPHPVVKNVRKNGSTYETLYSTNNNVTTYETTDTPVNYFDKDGDVKKLYLPRLWDITLPTWDGSKAVYDSSNVLKMRGLINNVMMIRGYQLPADFGHFSGPSYLIQPDPALPSISGLVADEAYNNVSPRLIPAIALTDSPARPLGYRSNNAKITLASSGGSSNKANDVLFPFYRNDTSISNHDANKALMKASLDNALVKYQEATSKMNPDTLALYNDNKAVDQLILKLQSLDIINEYDRAYKKYTQLSRASAEKFPGLLGELKLNKNSSGSYTSHPYGSNYYASHFALAEVFINHGLAASFTFLSGGSATPGSYVGQANNAHGAGNDEHNVTNRQLSFYAHHWKTRVFMASVNEFKKAIGSTTWKNTVIQFGAEYNRSPNKVSGGSDHAINACCTTIISGALDSFIPIGNIYKTKIKASDHANYGTYGVGAPTNIDGVGPTKIDHKIVANTVLTLLGITSPFRDKWSLIKKVGKLFRINTEIPKNLDI